MTDELSARTSSAVDGRSDVPLSSRDLVMAGLADFRADPSASTWYGYVVRLALLVPDAELRAAVLGAPCPFLEVTAQALVDADAVLLASRADRPT